MIKDELSKAVGLMEIVCFLDTLEKSGFPVGVDSKVDGVVVVSVTSDGWDIYFEFIDGGIKNIIVE